MNSLSWWLWSIFLAAAAIRSQNNLFGLLLILLLTFVVSKYKNSNNWGNPFKLTLQLALAATLIRLFFAVLIGTPLPGKIIFSLPQLELPNWLAGIRVGGDVTQERMFSVFNESLKFAVVLIAFGAASALSSPIQVIKLISGRIYLFGVTLIISVSVLPQIVHSFNRVIAARRMRGLAKLKLSNFRSIITPVLEESIERAIDLSAAMESRGFGYSKKPTRYRPEKFENQDLIIISIAVYLLIFTPILIKTIGVFPALTLFVIFASAPLLLFKSKRVHV
jgi:energy-coupling factor transporter transmembrane protein EcfT